MSDTYDVDLARGIGQFLAARGHGTWRDTGAYATDETGIVLDKMPDNPANAIVLSPYGVSDDVSMSGNTTGLQIRTRAAGQDPAASRLKATQVFLELHGRSQLTLPTGLLVVQMYRQSATSGGQDSAGRWSMIQNFYCDLYVPEMNIFTDPEETL